ncbi:hypothetical protein [Streptomyces sp. NPDC046759]|uniref:hypothetical protein n=1 Tax=Streptomyces sp. NPDC046759 TaxID=3155019 RepID=UPI0033CB8A80
MPKSVGSEKPGVWPIAATGRPACTSRRRASGATRASASDGERAAPAGTTAGIACRGADGCRRFAVLNPLGTA